MGQFSKRSIGKTDLKVTTLGLGGAPFGGLDPATYGGDPTDLSGDNVRAAVRTALDAGINFADTAPFYGFGLSERLVGDGLRLANQSYVVSTKVGRLLAPGANPKAAEMGWPHALPFSQVYDYSYDGVMRSFEDSLQRMGIDKIDMLFLHDIGPMTHGKEENDKHFPIAMSGGYKALDELRSAGTIKAIGLGVNEWEVCKQAMDYGHWDTFLLAGRYTLLEQEAADNLFPECAKTGTTIITGGPFNSGILAGGKTWNYDSAPQAILDKVKKIDDLCKDHNVEMPAAAMQFPLGHPVVSCVIPGPRNDKELKGILKWAQATIPESFWSDLKSSGLVDESRPLPTKNPFIG